MRNIPLVFLYLLFMISTAKAQKIPVSGKPLFAIMQNYRIGYIDAEGKIVIPCVYLNGSEFSEGLAAVRTAGRFGFIDEIGNWVIKPQYEWAKPFVNGLAIVYKDGKPFYIDHHGRQPFDVSYSVITPFYHGRACVWTQSGKTGYIDTEGELIIDTIYNKIGPFCGGLAVVHIRNDRKADKVGLIDTTGRIIFPIGKYKAIEDFNEGYSIIEDKKEVSGVIDTKGRLVFSRPTENNIFFGNENFCNGYAKISLYKFWIPEEKGVTFTTLKSYPGLIDLHNKIVLDDTTITNIIPFSARRAFVKRIGEDYKMINTKLQPVGEASFRSVRERGFENGYAIVETDNGWGIIDTNAHFVAPPVYPEINECGIIGNYFFYTSSTINDSSTYGVANLHGEKMGEPVLSGFDQSGFINGLLKVTIHDKVAFLNTKGEIVWQNQDTVVGDSTHPHLTDLDIDFMMRGYFYAYSTPDDGRTGHPINMDENPVQIPLYQVPDNVLSVIIAPSINDSFAGLFTGHPIYVMNTTKDTVQFNTQDNLLYMKMQALDGKGVWKDIDYLPSSWCGNSYYQVPLAPAAYWKFVIPAFKGEIATKLRVELTYVNKNQSAKRSQDKGITIYSNIIDGFINPAQFWNKRHYQVQGLMDPYLD
jgi:WG repeat protein